ncbi:glycine cleavage system protein GcvH [Candidatus Bathyarchaeota archaeon]|nr:MAG: glycine cleavage system protein GcvH [Candidatus Bathyarchaeota archaeon]
MVVVEGYNMPEELYYVPEDGVGNAWARVESDGTVTVGIDDFFQKQAKAIKYVDLPFEGDTVEQFKAFATLESEKWVGKVPTPVSGEVAAVNNELLDNPRLINEDPYGKGWFIKIKPSNLEEDLKKLVHGVDQIKELIKKSIQKYQK